MRQKILNYRQISHFLRGEPKKLQGTFIPAKYRAAVKELELLVERWKNEHRPN